MYQTFGPSILKASFCGRSLPGILGSNSAGGMAPVSCECYRTLTGFESQSDHPSALRVMSFVITFSAHPTWGRAFKTRTLLFSPCLSGRDSYRLYGNNEIFGSFVWHFYFALENLWVEPLNRRMRDVVAVFRGCFGPTENLIKCLLVKS